MDEQTYRNVAKNCSAYTAKDCCTNKATNKTGDTDVSCTTCKHFMSNHHCALDLIDPIVKNHKF